MDPRVESATFTRLPRKHRRFPRTNFIRSVKESPYNIHSFPEKGSSVGGSEETSIDNDAAAIPAEKKWIFWSLVVAREREHRKSLLRLMAPSLS